MIIFYGPLSIYLIYEDLLKKSLPNFFLEIQTYQIRYMYFNILLFQNAFSKTLYQISYSTVGIKHGVSL